MKNITNLFYKMFTDSQLTEIRNYLLSKKLPIDILIEVNDHFVSQISDLQREENLSFEVAFEKTKESWKDEFKTTVPFYVLTNKSNAEITNFEKKIKIQNDIEIIKISTYTTILIAVITLLSLYQFDFSKFKMINKALIILSYTFGILPVFYNIIINRFMYSEKYKNHRFSTYQWRVIASFSIVYFIGLYIQPIYDIFNNIQNQHYSFETIIKLILYFSIFTIMIYTGVYHIRLLRTIKKVKFFIKYL